MADYPERDGHFAHKVTRLMLRTCAAQDIGTDAAYLVVQIAHTEDAKRYTAPVTFWNDQLQSVFGFTWGKLDRARKRAVEAGWLHYEPGGKAKVGRYWVLIPPQFEGLSDVAVDEDHPAILSTGEDTTGGEQELSSPLVVKDPGDIRGTSGGQPGDKCGTFLPKPNPTPKPKSSCRVVFDDDDMEVAKHIWRGVQQVAPEAKQPNLDGWANDVRLIRERDNRTHEAIRRLFDWANADSFWAANILSPAKLRKQWTQLSAKKGTNHGRTTGTGASIRHDPENPVEAL